MGDCWAGLPLTASTGPVGLLGPPAPTRCAALSMALTDVAFTMGGPPSPGGAGGRADEDGPWVPAEGTGAPIAASLGESALVEGEAATEGGLAEAATTGDVAGLPPQISATEVAALFLLDDESSTPKAPKRMLLPPASPPAFKASHCPNFTRPRPSAAPSRLSASGRLAGFPSPASTAAGTRRCGKSVAPIDAGVFGPIALSASLFFRPALAFIFNISASLSMTPSGGPVGRVCCGCSGACDSFTSFACCIFGGCSPGPCRVGAGPDTGAGSTTSLRVCLLGGGTGAGGGGGGLGFGFSKAAHVPVAAGGGVAFAAEAEWGPGLAPRAVDVVVGRVGAGAAPVEADAGEGAAEDEEGPTAALGLPDKTEDTGWSQGTSPPGKAPGLPVPLAGSAASPGASAISEGPGFRPPVRGGPAVPLPEEAFGPTDVDRLSLLL